MIVIHYTAMATGDAAVSRLCDPEFEVSAHYLIDIDGRIVRMVDETNRAWHAGAGQWGDVTDINSRSIGIELANCGLVPFAAAQMDALEALLHDITARHSITPERIIGHSDMAPKRKIDPGPRFDWRRLAVQGLSIWPETSAPRKVDNEAFFADLAVFGYSCETSAEARLSAFRDRFRPRHSGPLDGTDMALARDLAMRFPVDRTAVTA
ncbi:MULTISPECIES: N-acetylmuramoyl-L-alanine amidase [Pacificibacter]|uniref:N-acetylmuramoyl-L-alanine amidase n=1 Tax=Pacificibacter TaxID=1042323 RepID=UPI001C09B7A3|nr:MULTISPECIES: N-acetylmuramoyl-L-alanine amidase [Pacificibacter]MBU2937496.1 N-acetylmuramoyl-L-alanine amidase [Pacificibacter marinus]MDO6615676.1 N-acetylmuramoyl-L-alanine amidase [Pacificibacter sp. 1_MG-2023]